MRAGSKMTAGLDLGQVFLTLSSEVRELSVGEDIPRLAAPPSPLEFYREFVAPNRPCIISSAIDSWPALYNWTNEYLVQKMGDTVVSVDITPDGRGDAVVDAGKMLQEHDCRVRTTDQSTEPSQNPASLLNVGQKPGWWRKSTLPEQAVDGEPGCQADGNCQDPGYCGQKLIPLGQTTASEHTACSSNPGDNDRCHRCDRAGARDSSEAKSDLSDLNPGLKEDLCIGEGLTAARESSQAGGHFSSSPGSTNHRHGGCASPSRNWFVTPHERKMPFSDFLQLLRHSRSDKSLGVPYAQHQNGSFLEEYSFLIEDAAVEIPWATEALGCSPEAVNLWIGDERAVTSFHKDHYENLYAVVAGEKHFTLLPPVDLPRLYVREYPAARYWQPGEGGSFEIVPQEPTCSVPWSAVDPYPSPEEAAMTKERFPLFFEGPPALTCTVRAGELLYLPSMWFHHVRQSPDREGRTIALNFWYDMQFDIKYAYFSMLQALIDGKADRDEDEEEPGKHMQH